MVEEGRIPFNEKKLSKQFRDNKAKMKEKRKKYSLNDRVSRDLNLDQPVIHFPLSRSLSMLISVYVNGIQFFANRTNNLHTVVGLISLSLGYHKTLDELWKKSSAQGHIRLH